MKWVVDTCVIIDVLRGDGEFSRLSADALDAKMEDGLMLSPISYVELAPSFNGDIAAQDRLLAEFGIDVSFDGNREAVFAACRAWHSHILRKRSGAAKKRPIADVMIGAYAMAKGGLITRNETDFRSLFPDLTIYNPEHPNT